MTTEKNEKVFDQLSAEELREARGGIPYEKPQLIVFNAEGTVTCKTGVTCAPGNTDCGVGHYCKSGDIEPET
jgi:hypothetical protein